MTISKIYAPQIKKEVFRLDFKANRGISLEFSSRYLFIDDIDNLMVAINEPKLFLGKTGFGYASLTKFPSKVDVKLGANVDDSLAIDFANLKGLSKPYDYYSDSLRPEWLMVYKVVYFMHHELNLPISALQHIGR